MNIADLLAENNRLWVENQPLQREKVALYKGVVRLETDLQTIKDVLETTPCKETRQSVSFCKGPPRQL
jgi:hypothetical protein